MRNDTDSRGDHLAYVLPGNKLGDHNTANVLDTISMLPAGWTDHNEIRYLAQHWQQH